METKKAERLRKKIATIKRALAAEKRRFGEYDDGRDLRYLPLALFIKLQDYPGGLRYTKWFQKNFPGDMAVPDFLFEWTIILFKNGKLIEAEKKAYQAFCSNTYLFDKFFGKPIVPIKKYESFNLEHAAFTENLAYSSKQVPLRDFSAWLEQITTTEKFIRLSTKFIAVQKRMKTETDQETWGYLMKWSYQLEHEMCKEASRLQKIPGSNGN
jgi:hypothetical protein